MLNLTDIYKIFSLYLSSLLTSFVRPHRAFLYILFWSCRRNLHIVFIWNCWKNFKVFCLNLFYPVISFLPLSYSSKLESFLLWTLCSLACYKFTNVIFGVNNLQAYTAMILIDCSLLQFVITCRESPLIELDTLSTHSSSVVPWVAITSQLTAKLISFLVNRDASFLMLCLPEFTQPTLHFMLVFICAIYFVITSQFSSSFFLAQGKQLLLCLLSMNSLHLLSNIVLWDSGNLSSN